MSGRPGGTKDELQFEDDRDEKANNHDFVVKCTTWPKVCGQPNIASVYPTRLSE